MPSQEYKPNILWQSVSRFNNPIIRTTILKSIIEDENEPFYIREFTLLDKVIGKANNLFTIPDLQRDKDLINTYNTQYPMTGLPTLFSWNGPQEKFQWNKTLLQTIKTFNEEISDIEHPGRNYKNPLDINNGESKDVFRFYLWDVYARWVAKRISKGRSITVNEEQNISNIVCNVLCEVAVVVAGKNDHDMIGVVKWLNGQKWLDPKWGFSDNIVTRAKSLSLG